MKEKNIARSYARALVELGEKSDVGIAQELTQVTETINVSNDLENILFLEAFTTMEKQSVLLAVLDKLNISALVKNFFLFLCQEKRLGLFPLIFKEIIVIDDHNKGFIKGIIQGSEEVIAESAKDQLTHYIEQRLSKKVELTYEQSNDVTAGHRLCVEDLQLDATVDNQLERFKHTVLSKERARDH